METVPYRKSEIMIQTIPKGTLLFRISKDHQRSMRGVLRDDGKRCITPHLNIYFHPTPFTPYHMYKDYQEQIGKRVGIYILNKDIKVVLLVNPSKYTRMDRLKKRIFLKPCSTVKKGCMPGKGNAYDTCLSDTIITKYPDVVGMLGISVGDNAMYRKALKRGIKNRTLRKINKVKDFSDHTGIPELAIYPLTKRSDKDIVVEDGTKLETNYSIMKEMEYDENKLNDFMEKHAELNPETHFYVYKE